MFAVAITNQPLKVSEKGINRKEFEQKDRVVTVCIDDLFTELEQIGEYLQITEVPFNKKRARLNTKFLSRVVVDVKNETIEIFNPTISGRTIYYYIQNGSEFYCSTHIFLLRSLGVKLEENREVLPEFFVYRSVMPPNTLYRGIKKMSFGERLKFSLSNGEISVKSSHFVFSEPKIREESIDKIARKVSDILSNSIASIKPAKSDIALLLSGGLDSSILFKLSKDILDINRTFSTDYPFLDSTGNIEKRYSLSASKALGAEHSFVEFTVEDYLRGFIEAIDAAEEPLHHLQSGLIYLLFKKGIPDRFHTIISGLGADVLFGFDLHNEIFACNSPRYRVLSSLPGIKIPVKLMVRLTGRGEGIYQKIKLRNILKNSINIGNPTHVIWELGAYGSEQWAMKYFGCSYDDIINSRFRAINKYRNHSLYDLISILGTIDLIRATLEIWNKLAEKNKKMIYNPFCEEELLNYSMSIPWDIKLQKPKNVLRHVARLLKVPEFIITRRKSGFGMGAEAWAVKGGAFEPLIPLCNGIFEREKMVQLQSTDPKKSMTFWNILNYCIWKRLFIYNESVDDLVEELNAK
jgi:asparagine synthase (glutamine-hydrolysing)